MNQMTQVLFEGIIIFANEKYPLSVFIKDIVYILVY